MSEGSAETVYSRQNRHCRSANSIIVTGAPALPRTLSFCGIPLNSATVAAVPGAFAGAGAAGVVPPAAGSVAAGAAVVVGVALFESFDPTTLVTIRAAAMP